MFFSSLISLFINIYANPNTKQQMMQMQHLVVANVYIRTLSRDI